MDSLVISSDVIKDELIRKGASLIGIANIAELKRTHRIKRKELRKYSRAISIGIRLSDEIVNGIDKGPTLEYANHYREINNKLDSLTAPLVQELSEKGYRARAIPASKRYSQKDLAAEFPHKTAAILSGLGWIGKSALLISFNHGPRVRFGTVLTDAPLKADNPQKISNCRSCRACVDACPAQAITGKEWTFGIERKEVFDAFKCLKFLRIQEKKVGETICGICINVCPIGKNFISV